MSSPKFEDFFDFILSGRSLEYSMIPIETLQNLTYEWMKNCAKILKLDILSAIHTAKDLTTIEALLNKQIQFPFGYF
jgi:hypothetical protein